MATATILPLVYNNRFDIFIFPVLYSKILEQIFFSITPKKMTTPSALLIWVDGVNKAPNRSITHGRQEIKMLFPFHALYRFLKSVHLSHRTTWKRTKANSIMALINTLPSFQYDDFNESLHVDGVMLT